MKCFLVCEAHSIELPDGEVVVLGRGPKTRITDIKVSRLQVELCANYKLGEVSVRQLGANSSSLNGTDPLRTGERATLKSGITFQLLAGSYSYTVLFEGFESSDEKLQSNALPERHLKQLDMKDFVVRSEKSPKKRQVSISDDEFLDDNIVKKSKVEEIERGRKLHEVSHDDDDDGDDFDDDKQVEEARRKLAAMRQNMLTPPKVEGNGDALENGTNGIAGLLGFPANLNKVTSDTILSSEFPADQWQQVESLMIFTRAGVRASSKIAAFDIDGTIICTQSGRVFPRNEDDWRILFPEIPPKLYGLHADGYKIVFFTNQLGIEKGKLKVEDFRKKISGILKKLDVPVQIFVATGRGMYRKPAMGMWNYLANKANDGIPINIPGSLYVGDAAGRPLNWVKCRKKDFSCGDRLFSLNVGLKFFTPEEYFLKWKTADYALPDFDPRNIDTKSLLTPRDASLSLGIQEVIILVGSPACGKSSFVQKYLKPKGYSHVNRDTLGSWQKCVAMCQNLLDKGHSCVVDNTNPDVESRARFVKIAKSSNVPCRCFLFLASLELCKHNERFREMTDKTHQSIGDVILHSYRTKFTEPSLTEGFSEIVAVNFIPHFSNQKHEELYSQFLLEN